MGKLVYLTGKKFNQWTVLKRHGNISWNGKKLSATWECRCDCGNTAVVTSSYLTRGLSKRCLNCGYKLRGKNNRTLSIYKVLFNRKVYKMAPKRGITVLMDEFQYYEIAKNDCRYCGNVPELFAPYPHKFSDDTVLYVNGVDRVDSSGPYSIENCVPCCKDCNFAKNNQSLEEFLKRVERIYNHSIKENK